MKGMEVRKSDIARHLDVLCTQIGNRYSGSKGEKRAIEYIAGSMRNFGLATHVQSFYFRNWKPKRVKAFLIKDGREKRIANIGPFLYSPSTPKEGITGDVIYIESSQASFFKAKNFRGKIGLNIGAFELADPQVADRIMDSGLSGMMNVDDRIPFPWRVPIGQAPQWSQNYHIPTVAVPYMKAIAIEKQLPAKARLEIEAWTGKEESGNVIGEIRGTKYPDQVIVVSAHTDSVLENCGADDNASGCAFVLELARLLSRGSPARTLRFISFGVEEKLSVGAYTYVRSLTKSEADKIVFCLNADSIGGRIGQDTAICTGTPEMSGYFRMKLDELDYPCLVQEGVSPYSDHFPLNIYGVPSVWATRVSLFKSSYWTLHSRHDSLENINLDVCARTVAVYGRILQQLTTMSRMPFPRKISSALHREVKDVAKTSYRHPWNPTF